MINGDARTQTQGDAALSLLSVAHPRITRVKRNLKKQTF